MRDCCQSKGGVDLVIAYHDYFGMINDFTKKVKKIIFGYEHFVANRTKLKRELSQNHLLGVKGSRCLIVNFAM